MSSLVFPSVLSKSGATLLYLLSPVQRYLPCKLQRSRRRAGRGENEVWVLVVVEVKGGRGRVKPHLNSQTWEWGWQSPIPPGCFGDPRRRKKMTTLPLTLLFLWFIVSDDSLFYHSFVSYHLLSGLDLKVFPKLMLHIQKSSVTLFSTVWKDSLPPPSLPFSLPTCPPKDIQHFPWYLLNNFLVWGIFPQTKECEWRRRDGENRLATSQPGKYGTLSNMLDHYLVKIKPDLCPSAKYLVRMAAN